MSWVLQAEASHLGPILLSEICGSNTDLDSCYFAGLVSTAEHHYDDGLLFEVAKYQNI